MKVLKFGGTSVGSPAAIVRVLEVVRQAREEGPVVVVVSAFGGVTNGLLDVAERASHRDETYVEALAEIEARHRQAADELAPDESAALGQGLDDMFTDLRDLLRGIYLLRECSARVRDGVAAYGERLSAWIVASALRQKSIEARFVDSRSLVVTDDAYGRARVDLKTTYENLRREFGEQSDVAGAVVAVVTGFAGSTPEGQTTTLGRGGSDYTAALVGAALDASAIELWTDVPGVMTADPRVVPQAFALPEMSYSELMEMSHFGAKVVYPPSIHPARSRGIPLWIKNTFDLDDVGTRVDEKAAPAAADIRGISSIRNVALARLEGDGMVGVPGIAGRLFGALARRSISVILISQGSSEHSICFAVAPEEAEAANIAVAEEFAFEHRIGVVDELILEPEQSVIAVVGAQMAQRPGIAGRIFGVLGASGVNVKAIAQGSSELNISFVVERQQEQRALTAIHDAFFDGGRRVEVVLLGVGGVGSALLAQIAARAAGLQRDEGLEIRVVGLANSRRLLLDSHGVALGDWSQQLDSALAFDRDQLMAFAAAPNRARRVLVDCTASSKVADLYRPMMARGWAVVAANKKPFAASQASFDEICRPESSTVFFEATVGAGLPILSTVSELVRTGDRVQRIDGVLSGTVNVVLDRLGRGESFSQAVRWAHQQGWTEPNPYDDLSGADVMRKLCILARLSGRQLEPDEIDVEPLLPAEPWQEMDLETFWQRLPDMDAEFEERRQAAQQQGCRLRYLAALTSEIGVRLTAVSPDHPAYDLSGGDNLVAITTERYAASPLVVKGPGAGTEVTAAGVFGDLLRAALS